MENFANLQNCYAIKEIKLWSDNYLLSPTQTTPKHGLPFLEPYEYYSLQFLASEFSFTHCISLDHCLL